MAQPPAVRRNIREQQQLQKKIQEQMKRAAENAPVLPSDPELMTLHKEFILKAEKLATEYERKEEFDAAREVYESLVRLVPKYKRAEVGLSRVMQAQSTQHRRLVKIAANKTWQDAGVTLKAGMPVYIEVNGKWKVVLETGPEGVQIPAEIRPKNHEIKLGTLVGVIVASPADMEKPKQFVIKPGTKFVAEKTGRLYLRMFDIDPKDNEGQMFVSIQSTFITK